MFLLKFLESYAYFALSQVLVIYLHDEFDTSDFEAGTAYGMFGAAITGWGLALSVVMDNLGVKKSLLIGFSISAISSTICACTSSKILLYLTIFGFYPIGLFSRLILSVSHPDCNRICHGYSNVKCCN